MGLTMHRFLVVLFFSICNIHCSNDDNQTADKSDNSLTNTSAQCADGAKVEITGQIKDTDLSILQQVGFREQEPGKGMLMFQEAGPSCRIRETVAIGMLFCNRSTKTHTFDKKIKNCKDINDGWAGVIERKDGIDLGIVSAGSITITHSSENCMAGQFAIKANDKQVQGTFEAPRCESIK